jgi:transposase
VTLGEASGGARNSTGGWEFDRFTTLLEYQAEGHGIVADRKSERDTSKTCSCCDRKGKRQSCGAWAVRV